ncbi:hypothetical protein HP567_029695 (plasmid) [Brevibacillus sp. M2.1A]|uniref:hypothetical protein n=1 Tax=Brevibacillus TaxID=55080 RepID=UPI00156ACFD1|nr:hypothetical protein [Brevibacillus sp. M2.1A]MCC8438710.1 hypothetical protein [Brevibacillus sp. M2.1A]
MRMKQINLEKRKQFIEELREEIIEQERIIKLIESYKPTSLEERIIHEYAIEGNVSLVADKLNKEGLRIGNRKYISNDISAVLKQKPMDDLHQIVKKSFEHNKAGLRYF